jgi:hypothetical protein
MRLASTPEMLESLREKEIDVEQGILEWMSKVVPA